MALLLRLPYSRLALARQTVPVLRRAYASDASSSSVVLPRLMADLKDAMRAKDTPKLNVLRSLRAEITNASKTPKPIDSDSKFLALLNKQIASSEKAIAEFESAKRADLVEKERGQVQVLQAYVAEIPVLGQAEVDGLVSEVLAELRAGKEDGWKPPFGLLMKGVMGKVAGRPVDQSYVTEKIRSQAA